jgi:hypothetical protein
MIPPKKRLEYALFFVAALLVAGAMEGEAVGVISTELVFTILAWKLSVSDCDNSPPAADAMFIMLVIDSDVVAALDIVNVISTPDCNNTLATDDTGTMEVMTISANFTPHMRAIAVTYTFTNKVD